jgi:nucleotide-binding universal stress UspA family protein
MAIVCGIDGSANSREAARAAAALAKLDQDELTLVYVQEALVIGIDPVAGATPVALANTTHLDADRERMRGELAKEAAHLADEFGIEVKHVIRTGLPDHELAAVATELEAELLVVASLGRRAATMWRFGSVADRLSQSSPVALLVVRDPGPFERWARAGKEGVALSVVLALGSGKPTQAAVRAAEGLTKLGRCALTEVHVYDPLEEARRRGLADPESSEVRGRIENALARELPPRFGQEARGGRFVALPARGQVAETLAEYVGELEADLLVLGTHRHGALRRRFFGSVSYGVLPMVETNVLVVPPRAEAAAPGTLRRVRRALVATDLSDTGNRAVEMALGLVPEGCQLVLLHVDVPPELPSGWIMGYHPGAHPTPGERRMKRALAEAELEKLAAAGRGRALETVFEVVESSDVPRAILEAAERHEADLLCLGTHHYGRVASALIGSVARTVARRSTRPVLLVPVEAG